MTEASPLGAHGADGADAAAGDGDDDGVDKARRLNRRAVVMALLASRFE